MSLRKTKIMKVHTRFWQKVVVSALLTYTLNSTTFTLSLTAEPNKHIELTNFVFARIEFVQIKITNNL